ncbi:MAG: MBL fold metallo-hydrolase [Planctomycetota bacterium]
MRVQVLSSGSRGNATLLRAGDQTVLVDAGLGPRVMRARLEAAGVGLFGIDHILVSHAHLDHSRSTGKIARSYRATLHATERNLGHRACAMAQSMATMPANGTFKLNTKSGAPIDVRTVTVPHDCDPTIGFRFEHEGRVLAHVTDLGEARDDLVRALVDPHVLVVESNHDLELLATGPYPAELKRRVAGPRGHLSNAQAADLIAALAGPRLHTVVLAHLSEKNNTPELAVAAARAGLARRGREDVTVLVAAQDEVSALVKV